MDRLLSAPESLAQSVLVALCDNSRIQARALRYLGELEDYAAKRAVVTSTTAATATSTIATTTDGSGSKPNPLKRQTPMEPGQICLQCERAFTPSGNAAEACLFHPGQLEPDDEHETWADWDDHVGGPMDSLENQEEYPEAFIWDCCDRNSTESGCTRGYHVAIRRIPSKKLWSGESPDQDRVRMYEGRALKANEFVNELLWTEDWDGYAASRSLGGWGTTEHRHPQLGQDAQNGTEESRTYTGEAGLQPPQSHDR